MKNWILFNLVLLMSGAAFAQVQMVAATSQSFERSSQTAIDQNTEHSAKSAAAEQALRAPASAKPVPKITNDDEIADEMDAANASAQSTYQKRAIQIQEQAQQTQVQRPAQRPVQRPAQRPVQYRAVQAAPTVQSTIEEGDYNPYKAPARKRYVKPVARTQTQPVYRQAYAEQLPRAQAVQAAPQAPAARPQYQAQPINLTPNPSQIQQFPENHPAGYIAEQDWYPVRRTGVTLLPTLNFGFGTTSADFISNTTTGYSITHQSKFIFGGGLMAEFGRSTFTFETGLLYVMEQVNASYTNSLLNVTSDNATLSYMGVPLLAKVNFSVIPHRSRLSVSAGVIPAILVSSKFDYITQNNGFQTDISNPSDSYLGLGGYRTFNVFGTAAIGGDVTVGSQSDVRAELAYRRALMSLTQNQNTFEDVFLLNVSFGFDVDLFSRSTAQQTR